MKVEDVAIQVGQADSNRNIENLFARLAIV